MPKATRGTIATLGGYNLPASAPISWTLSYGVKPHIGTFDMKPQDADKLMGGGKTPISLVIDLDGVKPLTVSNLWVLHKSPGDSKYVSKVAVADRRWFWSYGWIAARYNMRRTIGSKLISANDKQPALIQQAQLFSYANWSVKQKGVPMTAEEVLADVLFRAGEPELSYASYTGAISYGISVDPAVTGVVKALPLEDIFFNHPTDMAIHYAMSACAPQGALRCLADGTLEVTSMATGKETELVSKTQPEIVGRGHLEKITNERIRASGCDVYFVREHEVRFDFNEVAAAQSSGTTTAPPADPLGEQRVMENVVPITDYNLVVEKATLPQGTWITVDQAMVAYGTMPGLNTPLDHSFLQQAGVPDMDLWGALQIAGAFKQYDVNWAARIAAIQTHYRRTFRINPHWRDRILGIRAYRVATIDVTRGTRAPAMAYGDYAFTWSQRSFWKNWSQGGSKDNSKLAWAVNHSGYPNDGAGNALVGGVIDSNAYPSPARVSILDSDQGIIHVDYVQDANRLYEDILPSNILSTSMPLSDLRQRTNPLTWDSVLDPMNPPTLSPKYNVLVIVTAVPAAPNGLAQYFKIAVSPGDVADLVPQPLGACNGPRQAIFIGPGLETARFAWNDGMAKIIDQSFGVTDGSKSGAVDMQGQDLSAALANLCMNYSGTVNGAASLERIARASAARLWASQVDRFEGSASGQLNALLAPAGWASSVIHELGTRGDATTRIQILDKIPQFDIRSALPASDRQAIGKLVFPI